MYRKPPISQARALFHTRKFLSCLILLIYNQRDKCSTRASMFVIYTGRTYESVCMVMNVTGATTISTFLIKNQSACATLDRQIIQSCCPGPTKISVRDSPIHSNTQTPHIPTHRAANRDTSLYWMPYLHLLPAHVLGRLGGRSERMMSPVRNTMLPATYNMLVVQHFCRAHLLSLFLSLSLYSMYRLTTQKHTTISLVNDAAV